MASDTIKPPFHFFGAISETQRDAFSAWGIKQLEKSEPVAVFHQVRAAQLRRSAGLLEEFHRRQTGLTPSFEKLPNDENRSGFFSPKRHDFQAPGKLIAAVKDRLQAFLEADESAVFRMNYLRTRVEAHEDLAQEALEAADYVKTKLQELTALFGDPNYVDTLIQDTSDLYEGEPRHRANPLDPPTPWERRLRCGQLP